MSKLVTAAVIGAGLAILLFLIVRSARRFEREQIRQGRWDEDGPLNPTEGPPPRAWSYGMQERLEVVGLWLPRKLSFRRRKRRSED